MTTTGVTTPTHLLVVEGRSDEHAVLHLCMAAQPGFEKAFDRHDAKSFEGVLRIVRGYVNQQGMIAVGFVVDADSTPEEHWRQVINSIAAANSFIQLPINPDPNGTIIPGDPSIGSPRIGIWVMPDNASDGELEDFVERMIPVGDLVWPRAQSYISGIPTPRKFDHSKITKAEVHAWLAARKFPGLIGVAIREGDLDTSGQLAQTFLRWLSRLFR